MRDEIFQLIIIVWESLFLFASDFCTYDLFGHLPRGWSTRVGLARKVSFLLLWMKLKKMKAAYFYLKAANEIVS